MWSDDEGPYDGHHVHLERALNSPQALSRPHPPIMIGGGGEKRTLRLVAKYAQLCNLFAGPEAGAQAGRAAASTANARAATTTRSRRPPTIIFDVGETGEKVDDTIADLKGLADMGVQTAIGMPWPTCPRSPHWRSSAGTSSRPWRASDAHERYSMKIGLHIPDFTWPGGDPEIAATLAKVARTADEAGFDRISVMDHFWQIGPHGPVEHAMLEAYTALGYLAANTERATLLTMVSGVIYRYPAVLAKR